MYILFQVQGSKLILFFRESIASSKATKGDMYKTCISVGSLQKFEVAAGEFQVALGPQLQCFSALKCVQYVIR